jgi:hypothetical protein
VTAQPAELAPGPETDYSDHRQYIVQRRYPMPRQSPVFLWLLLAATIGVDAVVFARMRSEPYPALMYTSAAFYALITGQLSVICIWSALRGTTIVWTVILPLVSAVCAALLNATFSNDPAIFGEKFTLHAGYYGLHVAVLLSALWLLQRTAYWRRRSGSVHVWQFSLTHVLIVMTVVALLVAVSRHGPLFSENSGLFVVTMLLLVALPVAAVVIWSLSSHWILRLAAVLGFAVLSAAVIWLMTGINNAFFFGANSLIQCVVLSAWLAWAPILPSQHTGGATAEVE